MSPARRTMLIATAVAMASILTPWSVARAGGATEELRPVIDKVLRILDDPALKGPARTQERRDALRAVMDTAIDYPEAARRALALHWRPRTPAERDEFTTLFKDLVTYSYIRTMEAYAGETVQFVGESAGDGATTVQTRINRRQGAAIPVAYRMHRRDGRWLVYDVLVEGVSLVGNYRAQFNSIVETSSYGELITRMRAQVTELHEARR